MGEPEGRDIVMRALIFDTETTGLIDSKATYESPTQPHLVQLACILLDANGEQRAQVSLIVKPAGWTIPQAASDVHGITQEIADTYGVHLKVAVAAFTNLRAQADILVAHNISFDEMVMKAAIHRCKATPKSNGPAERFCTMDRSSTIVGLPPTARMVAAGFTKNKPPNLGEAVRFFFNEDLTGAHDAMVDAAACARLYLELRRREHGQ